MANKRYTLVLNFGYVESARMAFMPWTSKQSFRDAKEALVDLAGFLRDQYLIEHALKRKKCCTVTKTKDVSAGFCSKCGCSLIEATFDGAHFSDWLRELDTDVDTFHGIIAWDLTNRWQSEGLEGAPNPRFVYQAEWVLAAAVGHPKDANMTFEKICKDRTKRRAENFNYY